MKHLILVFILSLGFGAQANADQYDTKLRQLMALEGVGYPSLKQAGTVFDLDGWALEARRRGYHDGIVLAYMANHMTNIINIPVAYKNSLLNEPWTKLAYIGRRGEWTKHKNTKLNARRLKPTFKNGYITIGVQFYPELDKRTDDKADLYVVFRKARTGLKVFNITTRSNNMLGDPLANLEDKSPQQMTQMLLNKGLVSGAQAKSFGQLKF